jgi:hypothetical protein
MAQTRDRHQREEGEGGCAGKLLPVGLPCQSCCDSGLGTTTSGTALLRTRTMRPGEASRLHPCKPLKNAERALMAVQHS